MSGQIEPGTCAVYEIQNRINGKLYVGSSVDVRGRFWQHRHTLRAGRHYNTHLQRAWALYGEGAFDFVVVVPCTRLDRLQKEQERFTLYSRAVLYNIATEATGGRPRGFKCSEEHKRKIGDANRGRPSWNKGGQNTWHDRIVQSRLLNLDHQIRAAHIDGRVLLFSCQKAVVLHFGYKRKRVNEAVLRGRRLSTGWLLSRVPKQGVPHSIL